MSITRAIRGERLRHRWAEIGRGLWSSSCGLTKTSAELVDDVCLRICPTCGSAHQVKGYQAIALAEVEINEPPAGVKVLCSVVEEPSR